MDKEIRMEEMKVKYYYLDSAKQIQSKVCTIKEIEWDGLNPLGKYAEILARCWYTDKKDKDDKELYEKDLVIIRNHFVGNFVDYHDDKYRIEFYRGRWVLQPLRGDLSMPRSLHYLNDNEEIIYFGNIYQNPELLNKE